MPAEQSLCRHPHRLKHVLQERLLVEGEMRTNQSTFVCFLFSSRTSFHLLKWLCSFSYQCELMMYCSFDVFAQELSDFLVCNHQIWQWLLPDQEANYQETINISQSSFQPLAKGYDKTRSIHLWHINCQLIMFLWCMDLEPVEHLSILPYSFYASFRCLRRVLEQLHPACMRRHLPSNSCPKQLMQAVSEIIAPMIT